MKEKLINFFRIFLPIILGGIVGFLIKDAIDYQNLVQPPLAPPKIVFPIFWSILYILMGISYYLYRKENDNTLEIFVYYAQLILNLSWTIIFFILKLRLLSIFIILFIIILVLYLIIKFWHQKRISAYLLIPYIIWLIFALYLNVGIFILN